MQTLSRSISHLVTVLALGSGVLAAAPTQETQAKAPLPNVKLRGVETRDLERMLNHRERGNMHPGEPLDLVGLEEGDNDFRKRTPLLLGADTSGNKVDAKENHRRRIAMYEKRASFSLPLPGPSEPWGTVPDRQELERVTPPPPGAPNSPEESDGETPPVLWLAAVALAVIVAWSGHRVLDP